MSDMPPAMRHQGCMQGLANLWRDAPLELNHYPHAIAVTLVANIGDAADDAGFGMFRNRFHKSRLLGSSSRR